MGVEADLGTGATVMTGGRHPSEIESINSMTNAPTLVAGIDGCPKGWVAVLLSDCRFGRAELAAGFTSLLPILADARVIAIDIPIGLPTGKKRRLADTEARKLLGGRGSSVFPTPPRLVLEAPTYAEANRISKQSFGSPRPASPSPPTSAPLTRFPLTTSSTPQRPHGPLTA